MPAFSIIRFADGAIKAQPATAELPTHTPVTVLVTVEAKNSAEALKKAAEGLSLDLGNMTYGEHAVAADAALKANNDKAAREAADAAADVEKKAAKKAAADDADADKAKHPHKAAAAADHSKK